ncbi:MAG: FtsX-like permease family protein [Bacteroidota bacterium]|nr:FtsX-like permease family protein [Bacteroidota bacterium]
MFEHISLAWRNIWRNKRRTLITTASIFFGVVLSAFMTSMQEGSYEQYIKTVVNFYSGYIQIHKAGYWDDKVINNTLVYTPEVERTIRQTSGVTMLTPRLENFALASSEEITKGVLVLGIDPQKEDSITRISKKIIYGNYLRPNDNGVVIGSGLAGFMKLNVGDTLVLIGQGFHGSSAAGKYPVRGIVKQPSPELDRTVVYMLVAQCQELFSASGRLTSVVIMVTDKDAVPPVFQSLKKSLGKDFEVMDWQEMNRILLKQIESDRAQGVITKGILYVIIGFGILGTIMMMVAERKKEMGVLVAIGMQKSKLASVLVFETIFIGMVGVIAGIVASIPVIWYFMFHPILMTGQAGEMMLEMGFDPYLSFSIMPSVFYNQALTVFIFTLIIGLYPVFIISRLKIIKALRN